MITKKYILPVIAFFGMVFIIAITGCERDEDNLQPATFPSTAEVFIDGFSAGLNYAAFGGSDPKAFDVDTEVKYSGSSSMIFKVPDAGAPQGAYAGGVYYTDMGRDLSGYNVLTFWARASKAANIDLIGLGNDLGENRYQASISNVPVNTNWQKYYIPIPDPSKLTEEKGMFFYSEGPEDGKGYTFWIDEVKFEKLGTIAHQKAMILGSEDKTESTFNSLSIPIDGLGVSFNLPTGVDQKVNATPAYFTFSSTEPGVATVSDKGLVTVLSSGTAVITATLGALEAEGSLTVESSGEYEHAPVPQVAADKVISLFSDAYTNEPVDYYNGYWAPYQTTLSADFAVNDDHVLSYYNFNFVGIQFTDPVIDASTMTHFHMDIFTNDPDAASKKLAVQIVDAGADGQLGTDDDSSGKIEISDPQLEPGKWLSIDIPFSSFSELTARAHLAQVILDGNLTGFFADNIYFYEGEVPTPAEAAPAPDKEAANVLSVFSDAYTDLAGTDFNPNWGQATVVTQEAISGNNTMKYKGLNYQGIQLGATLDASGMSYLHIDFWTANATALNIYLISDGPVEKAYALTVPTTGWSGVDIPLSAFSGVDLTKIIQFKFDGNGDIYWDNLYFWKEAAVTDPVTAAPTPTQDAANVISVFSDAYTDISGVNFNPNWGQSTVVSTVDVAGNPTLSYATFNYQGTEFPSQDISQMEYIHIDLWTADATDVQFTPISAGTGEKLYSLSPINTGVWNSYDIPLTYFTDAGMQLNDIFQLKFDGQAGTNPSNIWLDNIYFYKTAAPSTEPTTAAPTPPARDAADVVSVFSDVYTDISGINYNPNWGQSTVVSTVDIAGNPTLSYATFNYQGTDFAGNAQDLTGMEYLHIDMWTADATDVKVTPINGAGSPAEFLIALSPISAGQWVSYDISLADFTASGMTLDQVIQIKFDGQGGTNPSNIWLDNIYFYKTAGGSGSSAIFEESFIDSSSIANWQKLADANSSEASIEWISDGGVTGGAMQISGTNPSDTAGKAYIFQLTANGLNYDGATNVRLTFDLKLASPLTAAAVHLQTDIPGVGVTNNFDLQNGGLNESTWTSYTVDFSGVDAGANTFTIHFNFASGAVTGAGGTLLVDNIKLVKN